MKICVDNSKCDKMITSIKFSVKRLITAYGHDINGVRKQFKDEQDIVTGSAFEFEVAAKEPMKISRDYAILMKKVREMDTEQNRFIMTMDFANGFPLSETIQTMQGQFLPSVSTQDIQIEYKIEAKVCH